MKALLENFSAEEEREDISNHQSGIKVYMKLVMIMGSE
jgi:hypothetical protein